jgi:hypothetical protein
MHARRPVRLLSALLLLLLLPALPAAAKAKPEAGPAPLLDRELFFDRRSLAPSSRPTAIVLPEAGRHPEHLGEEARRADAARPITDDASGRSPSTSGAGREVRPLRPGPGGDELTSSPWIRQRPPPKAAGPRARNLTDAKGARAQINAVPRSDPDLLYVGLNDRDAKWHDLYKVKISTGERTLVRKNEDKIAGWVFDNKDQLRLAVRITDNGTTEVLRADADKFTPIYSCSVLESCGPSASTRTTTASTLRPTGDDVDLTVWCPIPPPARWWTRPR